MAFMRNATVNQRLLAGFGSIVFMIIVFAGIAWSQLSDIKSSVLDIVDDRFPKVDISRDIYDNVNVQARMLRNAIIAVSVNEKSQAEDFLAKAESSRVENSKKIDQLKAMINTPKGQELFKTLVETRAEYAKARDEAIGLIKEGKWEDAGKLTMGNVRAKQDQFLSAITGMAEFQQDLMAKSAVVAKERVSSTIVMTIGVAAAVLALALLMTWVTTRALLADLGGEPAAARDAAQRIAQGDLHGSIAVRHGDTTSLFAALRTMQQSLVEIVDKVRQGSESVATASAQIAQGNQDLSGRTEEQASALEETAATMEQLGSTVRNNADSARQANQLAQAAAGVATQGGEVVADVVTTMQNISESSRKIGDIIGVIDGIAFQTNILALNAAVEAARAGEQGRGFAVVAGEVRGLAQRSAEAAKEIKTLITRNVEQVEQGANLVDRAGKTMDEIVGSIKRVTDIVAEISAATTEQSNGIQQVGEAVGQMDQATQQNAALVEESAAAAESLKNQAQVLVQAVSFFRSTGMAHGVAPMKVPAATPKTAVPAHHTAAVQPSWKWKPKAAPIAATAVAAATPVVAAKAPALATEAASEDEWATF